MQFNGFTEVQTKVWTKCSSPRIARILTEKQKKKSAQIRVIRGKKSECLNSCPKVRLVSKRYNLKVMKERDMDKAALRGEPSYVWRAGQQRRLEMIIRAAGERIKGYILEDGCGVGMYVERLSHFGGTVIGLEYDFARAIQARTHGSHIINGAGESLPLPSEVFELILSHEVLEHVRDDHAAICEMIRVLRPGGRIVLFVPNRGYPFETHGIYWKGKYRFGNKLFVNYLPRTLRNKLAPHVRVYSKHDLEKLFSGLPVQFIERTIIFGAYDNIIAKFGWLGRVLRGMLQFLEKTPLKIFGLSHFWVMEKL
jgi:SAM-dependent methyltransferase